jgi:hypothetical protein
MRGHNAGRDGQFAGGFLPETIPAEALFLEQRVRCGAFAHADLASPDRVGRIARHCRALDHGVSDPRSQYPERGRSASPDLIGASRVGVNLRPRRQQMAALETSEANGSGSI